MIDDQQEKIKKAIMGTFIWSFKKGDNIIYNFGVLWELYSAKKVTHYTKKELYNKPRCLRILARR